MEMRIRDLECSVGGVSMYCTGRIAPLDADTVKLEHGMPAVAKVKTGRYVKVEFLSVTHRGGPLTSKR
jgi:hypothetical protein